MKTEWKLLSKYLVNAWNKRNCKTYITKQLYIYIYEMLPILIGLYMCMQKKRIKKRIKLNIVPSLN